MFKAIIIARCSTNETKQDVSRQSEELHKKFSNQFEIVRTFAYYQSGTKNEGNNLEMLSFAINNGISNIIISEISRISRKVVNVLQFIELCNDKKINVIIDNYNLHTLNKDRTVNTMVQMMLSIGASFAQLELQQTYLRLASGRKKYLNDGGVLGRKKGSIKNEKQILIEHADIVKYLKLKQSVRNIMKLTSKSNGTIQKVSKILKAKECKKEAQ
ncbi:recombinase family protein [Flavobacterium qiangtangense]|uniref:Recombinase family protein n=1 Tax=Flavobacterium qiangtangense TaxID=1442595 RepID=A0ABW1PR17_9FLAO